MCRSIKRPAFSPYLQLTHGLDFGPSVGPRWGGGGTDAGNELNLIGQNASSLAQAITNGDYITFTVNPVSGAGIIPNSVSFQLVAKWQRAAAQKLRDFVERRRLHGRCSARAGDLPISAT